MKSKEDYRSFNFLLSDEYKEDIKELLDISDEIVVFFKDKSKRTSVFQRIAVNSMISIIYEETTIYGMFEVKFRTNIPIEEIREIKLKKLIND
jgi:cyanate lyase